ncbi:PfkB family carbohydrate kinase, partial [Escherichia coli]|nr:PfkB family carbohydrate kinase [Escherichia coli]
RMLIRHAGVVLADCNLTPAALEWIFTVADGIPVFIDTVSKFKAVNVKNWLPHIHTLKPTQKELEILWGSPVNNETDLLTAVNALHQQGVQQIFVWMGDESVFCSQREG